MSVDSTNVTLDNVKSSLYCVRCNRILRDAVEVSCCHALYCSSCVHPDGVTLYDPAAMDVVECCNCGRAVVERPAPNYPVRRLVGTIPVPCTNEGCTEIVAAGAMQEHTQKQCDYAKVGCRYFGRGCAATMLRKENSEHEQMYCIFRDVACPQGCGKVMEWRECSDHFLLTCPRTLVDCQVKCGSLVERSHLFEHMNECPLKPLPCPYRSLGCTLQHVLRRPELEEHMAISIHAHLQLVDAKMRSLESIVQRTSLSDRRPLSHDWDPGHVRCVGRWDAQPSSIYAMAVVDGFLVTGCESGTLMLFDPFNGDVVRTVATGDQPIRSLLGLGDGRLVVGRRHHSVLVYSEQCQTLIASATLHPKEITHSVGVLALAKGAISKQVHVEGRPQFYHPELYAVPTCVDDQQQGTLEVIFAATEHHIRVLDAATLEEVEHICGFLGSVTSVLVHLDMYVIAGSADGTVRVHDMARKGFPALYQLPCFGGSAGVRALCIHPAGATWCRSAADSPATAPVRAPHTDTDASVIVCIGGGDGSLGFWDCKHGGMVCDLVIERAHRGAIVCMLPVDGQLIATGGADEYWRAWDGKAQTSHADLPGSTYCAVARDAMMFAAGAQGCIRLWTSCTLRYNEKRQPPQKKQIPL